MEAFKLPQTIPQDLLLIQDIIGPLQPASSVETSSNRTIAQRVAETNVNEASSTPIVKEEDDIGSSGEENDSEDEIAADLIKGASTDEDESTKVDQRPLSEPAESTSNSESESDSDSSDAGDEKCRMPEISCDMDDDEDTLPAGGSNTYFTTKHEVFDADIPIPDVDEIGTDEVLEKVGEVMNIIDRLAIVRGLPVDSSSGRSSDQALDSDTLLVFDDRKVMGYIYETFGPTTQPLYQVKFNSAFPLDPERVRIGREVFHVPARSRFVFLSQIKAFKGSDASNVHDEEPADDELEFSDDEAEAAYKAQMKRKRGESRARSVASSRQTTPNPTLMRDQELADEVLSRNAYDEHGPYDIDYANPGPSSRPAPIPYDDPYGDDYTSPELPDQGVPFSASVVSSTKNTFDSTMGTGYGKDNCGRDIDRVRSGFGQDRDRGRGRGRGRGRVGQYDRGRGRGGGNRQRPRQDSLNLHEPSGDPMRSFSTSAGGIPRANAQPNGLIPQQPGVLRQGYNHQTPHTQMYSQETNSMPWNYGAVVGQYQSLDQRHQPYGGAYMQQRGFQQNPGYHGGQEHHFGYPPMPGQGMQPFIQPHINPRFASAFGLGIGAMPQAASQNYGPDLGVSMAGNNPTPFVSTPGTPSLPMGSNQGWVNEWSALPQPQSAGTPDLPPAPSANAME